MKSTVMNNAYFIINKFYFSNGVLNQEEEMKLMKNNKIIDLNEIERETLQKAEETKKESNNKMQQKNELINNENISGDKITKETEHNFINGRPIISYYNKFCKQLIL